MIKKSTIKILALSDIHGYYERFPVGVMPDADLVVIAGDITNIGLRDTRAFLASERWLAQIVDRYPVTLWIPGNHDLQMPPDVYDSIGGSRSLQWNQAHQLHCVLDKPFIYIGEGGSLSFYGVTMCPCYNMPELAAWAHSTTRWEVEQAAYDMPPVDVVLSHCPPNGILDFAGRDSKREPIYIGSRALGHYLDLHQPRVVICGHAHGNIGMHPLRGRDNDTRIFNVAETFRLIEVEGSKI